MLASRKDAACVTNVPRPPPSPPQHGAALRFTQFFTPFAKLMPIALLPPFRYEAWTSSTATVCGFDHSRTARLGINGATAVTPKAQSALMAPTQVYTRSSYQQLEPRTCS